jgi:hypothetical protein
VALLTNRLQMLHYGIRVTQVESCVVWSSLGGRGRYNIPSTVSTITFSYNVHFENIIDHWKSLLELLYLNYKGFFLCLQNLQSQKLEFLKMLFRASKSLCKFMTFENHKISYKLIVFIILTIF